MISIFDIDGTLTPHRSAMHPDNVVAFVSYIRRLGRDNVYLLTGSDYEKAQQQLPENILHDVGGVFCCMGNMLVSGGELLYENRWKELEDPHLEEMCKEWVDESEYPKRTGNHIERRIGMLNVSSVGRNADVKLRREYHAWDRHQREREHLCKLIQIHFPFLQGSVGGMISVDITKKGRDKAQVLNVLRSMGRRGRITYFGDRYNETGNDRPIIDALLNEGVGNSVHCVDSPHDTFELLGEFTR